MLVLLSLFAFNVGVIWTIKSIGLQIAKIDGSSIRIVAYVLSFTLVLSLIIAVFASQVGAIAPDGEFRGEIGHKIEFCLKLSLDLNTDSAIFGSLFSVAVIPQLISYFLSGLFGCASSPIFIGLAFRILLWSFVKALVTASGVLYTILFYGMLCGWDGWTAKGALSMFTLSNSLVALSMLSIYTYQDAKATDMTPKTKSGRKLDQLISRSKQWMVRNSQNIKTENS